MDCQRTHRCWSRASAQQQEPLNVGTAGRLESQYPARRPKRLEFTWRNSEQLEGDLIGTAAALKQEPGTGDIALSGSVSVVRQLLAAGLLDELHLLVHPIVIRKGMRLFDEGDSPIPLTLLSATSFQTGVQYLVYGPAESVGTGTYEDAKTHIPQPA